MIADIARVFDLLKDVFTVAAVLVAVAVPLVLIEREIWKRKT